MIPASGVDSGETGETRVVIWPQEENLGTIDINDVINANPSESGTVFPENVFSNLASYPISHLTPTARPSPPPVVLPSSSPPPASPSSSSSRTPSPPPYRVPTPPRARPPPPPSASLPPRAPPSLPRAPPPIPPYPLRADPRRRRATCGFAGTRRSIERGDNLGV